MKEKFTLIFYNIFLMEDIYVIIIIFVEITDKNIFVC